VGGFEPSTLVEGEPTVKYHPCSVELLTLAVQAGGQCLVGSLTGAVASIVGRSGGNIGGKSGYMLGTPFPNKGLPLGFCKGM